jgi:hypothetical protein
MLRGLPAGQRITVARTTASASRYAAASSGSLQRQANDGPAANRVNASTTDDKRVEVRELDMMVINH